jgi:hypothetical protein
MAYQEPYPPFLTTLTSVFPQRSHPGRVRLVGEGLVSVDEASAFVEEPDGSLTADSWVIAFNTTGGRMVLQSYSSQPLALVLKMCQLIV